MNQNLISICHGIILYIYQSVYYNHQIYIILLSFILLCCIAILLIYRLNKVNQKKYNEQLKLHKEKINIQNTNLEKANYELKEYTEELKQQKEEIIAQSESLEIALKNLRELNEFKEGMVGMIVHDLKNPLNIILNLSKEDVIIQSGRQMLNMVNNILDVQKYETTSMPVDFQILNLYTIVENSLLKVGYLIVQKGINIENSTNHEFSVFADIEITERMFINLLTNAIKYTPNSGEICIDAEQIDGKFIKISITDNGPGIAEALKDRIFDKFTQIIAKKSGFTRSSGLGLTFCKLAAEAHGGKIGVDSEIGAGSSFWFTLPTTQLRSMIDEETKSATVKKQITLSNANASLLLPYLYKLKNLKVFEISEIQQVILKLKLLKIKELESIILALENAAYSVNQEEFDILLNLINTIISED